MLKLKLQYFGHLMQRVDSSQKTLMLGGIEGRRRRGRQRIRWLDGITDSMDVSLSELQDWWWIGRPGMLRSRRCKESDTTEQLNWTELKLKFVRTNSLPCEFFRNQWFSDISSLYTLLFLKVNWIIIKYWNKVLCKVYDTNQSLTPFLKTGHYDCHSDS